VKILLVSDLHYALKQYDWTTAAAPAFDLVVIAGDHLDIAGQLDGGVQIVVILNYLKRMAQRGRLIVSSGNHDLDSRDASGEKVAGWMRRVRLLGIPTDGDSVAFDDVLVTVCPWWDGPHALDAVRAQIERDAARPKSAWIWIYHAPPADSPTAWTGRHFAGDPHLRDWIGEYRPDLVFTGHIHEAPFKRGGSWADRIGKTWVFNSGQQIGPEPAHVAIDTAAHEAVWFSLAGAEIVRLDAPLARPFADLTAMPAWLAASSPGPGPSPV
jgi:Icc-related predicted phosphoesterase